MTSTKPLTATLQTKGTHYYGIFKFVGKDGKTKVIWRTLGIEAKPGNKRKALNKLEEVKQKFMNIMTEPGFEILFTDYLRGWIEKKKGEVDESTQSSIKGYIEKKAIPFFEPLKLRLSEVKPKHIKAFYDYLYKFGSAKGNCGLSISSIKSVKQILNEMFRYAIVEGLITCNPAEVVDLPARDNPRKPRTVLSVESANELLGYISNDDLMYPLLLTTLRYGLRKSEAIGLKWEAVDMQNNHIKIESVIVGGKISEKSKTKTKSSNKTFPLLPDVKQALLTRKKAQEEQLQNLGITDVPVYVFTYPNGKHLSPDWTTKRFQEILTDCGLPKMRYHDLRHSTACILYEHGMPIKELQEWMRHAKLEMTSDVYLHISKAHEEQLAKSLYDMFETVNEPDAKKQISR